MAKSTNLGVHVVRIMNMVNCDKHNAFLGVPCFTICRGFGNGYYPSICNERAQSAGANGEITPPHERNNRRPQPRRNNK